MPNHGRAKYHSTNLRSNTGTGKVVSSSGFMGRGLVIRKAIMRRSTCVDNKCYIGRSEKPTNKQNAQ
jgi:hypothetical protein